ncbi:MAG: hypothetical protein NWS16_07900, partial [Akkermansiaceae bacterium]|nr:hypothetical protein [Akkermansiaceae bacterium]
KRDSCRAILIIAEVVEPLHFSISAFQIFSFYPSSRLQPNHLRRNLRAAAHAPEERESDFDGWIEVSDAGEDEAGRETKRGFGDASKLLGKAR